MADISHHHRVTIKIALGQRIDRLEVDVLGELPESALIAAGYPVESCVAHLGDPAPADPGEDLRKDSTWVLRSAPTVGTRRAAAG